MKLVIYIVMVLFAKVSLAQKDSGKVVEIMPEYPGGVSKMMIHYASNINYPQRAKEAGIQGRCYLEFVIDTAGKVTNTKIVRGVPNCPECDAEAMRVINSMPKWKPGIQNGRAVPVLINVPISFKLDSDLPSSYNGLPFIIYDIYGNMIWSVGEKYSKLPSFIGGVSALNKYLDTNNKLVNNQLLDKSYGFCIVNFSIENSGEIAKSKIVFSSGNKLQDDEAIRLISNMPKWSPAIKSGEATKTACKIVVLFSDEVPYLVRNIYLDQNTLKANKKSIYNDGYYYFQDGKFQEALDSYQTALAIEPNNTDILFNIGVANLNLHRMDKACLAWNKAKKLGKTEADELIKKYCSN